MGDVSAQGGASVTRPLTKGPSRREFLRAGGLLAGAVGLPGLMAACSAGDTPPTGSGAGKGKGTVRFWTIPEGPDDATFQRQQIDGFMKRNPDVTVEAQFFPSAEQYGNAMQLAFTGGRDAPDIFRGNTASGVGLRSVKQRGWIRPITEFVTDDFKSRFPDWVYDAKHSALFIDKEAYAVPQVDPAVQAVRMLYYNVDVLERFGFGEPPGTWSQMREMASKITRDGGGKVYGMALIGTSLPIVLVLQNLAGPQSYKEDAQPPISLLTGKPAMSEPSVIETIELLQGMHSDNVFAPGWQTWSTQVFQQMAAGRLGMYLGPLFHVKQLRRANPKLKLGIAPPPVPDSGRRGSRAPADDVLGWWMMSAEVRNPEAAWRVLDFLGSVDYQREAFQKQKQISVMDKVYEGIEIDADTKRIREIASQIVRVHPDPYKKDQKAAKFYQDLVTNAPRPIPPQRYLEAITKGSNVRDMAAQYDEKLAAAIAKQLPTSGLHDMSAFTFHDWDPLTDYKQA
ncbi:ABC transporter substrate-binding protein [Kribbella pittospori]|nr:extracellular solute-binding protein [Kribbella pittospori]